MKIAFLNSSLEPEKDGVGDYTLALAGELTEQGHPACALALNDQFTSAIIQSEQNCLGQVVPILRLPSTLAWSARVERAKVYLANFRPDYISLQFVPYAFDEKGIMREVVAPLGELLRGYRVHLMFHELWIGANRGSSVVDRLVGTLQKSCVLRLHRRIRPMVVHTSNVVYATILKRSGIHAGILPLFGSIQAKQPFDNSSLWDMLNRRGVYDDHQRRDDYWVAGIFGAIYPQWSPEPLFSLLRKAAKSKGKKVMVVAVGRAGTAGEQLWAEMVRQYSGQIAFCHFGELPPATVSLILLGLDFGISTTPWALFGKSSTGASMIDHGVPVLVTRNDWSLRGEEMLEVGFGPLVQQLTNSQEFDFDALIKMKSKPCDRRGEIVSMLVNAMNAKPLVPPDC